jgi:hypothetical protein
MRLAPPVLALVSAFQAGCLYIGVINEPPRAELRLVLDTKPIKGATVSFQATLDDREDGVALTPTWLVRDMLAGGVELAQCDYALRQLNGQPGSPRAEVQFFRTGTFEVAVATTDRFGAASPTAAVTVTVDDAPPRFAGPATLHPSGATADACNAYVDGEPLLLQLDGEVLDADRDVVGCAGQPERLTARWSIDSMPAGSFPSLALAGSGACPPCPAAPTQAVLTVETEVSAPGWQQVCFCSGKAAATPLGSYPVSVHISDGLKENELTAAPFDVRVDSDAPPCIDGTFPPAGSYVVDRTQPLTLTVVRVADDRDAATATLAWSLYTSSDPVWRAVPSYSGRQYSPDLAALPVGEHVRVRAVPLDRLGARAGCAPDAAVCTAPTCLPNLPVCQEWVTWDLELR